MKEEHWRCSAGEWAVVLHTFSLRGEGPQSSSCLWPPCRCLLRGEEYAELSGTSEGEWEQTMIAITSSMRDACAAREESVTGEEGQETLGSTDRTSPEDQFRMPTLLEVQEVLAELQASAYSIR